MRRQWPSIAVSFYALACAQIAGFEQLSAKREPNGVEAGGAAGVTTRGGSSPSLGGATDRAGEGGSLNGDAGSNVNIGNNGGAPTSGAGSGAAGGAGLGNSGSGTSGAGGAEVVGGCNAEQLRNAHFDRGAVDWTQASTAPGILGVDDVILERGSDRLKDAPVAPQSGNYLAWLGGRPNSDQPTRVNLMQQVTIPAKVSGLVVTGWIQIHTAEENLADSNDLLDIALEDEDDFWSFHAWYIDEASVDWQPFEYRLDNVALLNAVRGRTLTFIVESKTDTSLETHFWVDSLSFVAECP